MKSAPWELLQVAQDVCDRLSTHGADSVLGDGFEADSGTSRAEDAVATSGGGGTRSRAQGAASLVQLIDALPDAELAAMLTDVARLRAHVDAIAAAGAGVLARRSRRELGYAGLAQREGHRTPEAMLQSIMGASNAEARRQVKLGEAMGEADAVHRPMLLGGATETDADRDESTQPAGAVLPWFDPITAAVTEHRITAEAGSAILVGLDAPNERVGADLLRASASKLIDEAGALTVDALRKRARFERDMLDPEGLELRATHRYEARLCRLGRDATGARTAYLVFDDESAAFVDTLVDAALRPRRGGPRFVDKTEAARAEAILNDSRSNEQLVFDLLVDTLRAGADADPSRAYGTRQPGVRIVSTETDVTRRDAHGRITGIGYYEHSREAVPGSVVERSLCTVGSRQVVVDGCGNPLDVGRDQRLFTASQRVALSIRDGGCLWPGCDRPPSYCEAHHSDHWLADHGKTDTRDGVLLCRHHHMLLHNNGWKIKRSGSERRLIPPRGIDASRTPIPLISKSPLRYIATG